MKKIKDIKKIHIAIIIIGILFNCISLFHPGLWFDEAYSVGIADKSFSDIWTIGGNDVHPVLYYWILHIIYIIGHSLNLSLNGIIISYRIFSGVCISILGILGFTHIRKDFGEKVGALFSFFAYFMPIICIYSAEIRMYSLAIVTVTLTGIYAYRLFKDDSKISNWIIFCLSSLASIYTHYYGLMAAGIINCVLLICLIRQKRVKSIIKILISGVIQLIAYLPWIMCLMKQMSNVSKGFWIGFEFPKTLYQLIGTQFSGNLKEMVGFISVICLYVFIIIRSLTRNHKKNCQKENDKIKPNTEIKENQNKNTENADKTKCENLNNKIAIISILIYFAVILAAVVITAVLKTSILYYRYLFVITGLFIFFISYFLGKEQNKYIIGTICLITIILSICSNYKQVKEAYDKNNMLPIEYLKQNVLPEDVIVFDESNFGTGSVVALNFTNNKQFYYNPSNWGVEEAYKAFGNQLKIYTNTDFLNECTGRIWIIDSENGDYYNKVYNNDDFKLISQKTIKTGYENYVYNMILVEKVK